MVVVFGWGTGSHCVVLAGLKLLMETSLILHANSEICLPVLKECSTTTARAFCFQTLTYNYGGGGAHDCGCSWVPEVLDHPETEVTGSYVPLDLSTGDQTLAPARTAHFLNH